LTKKEILSKQFGYTSFRAGQEEAIDAILAGKDVLAVMPTGAGKSLCYQIPALLLPGITVVISPLISLMKDQVNALQEAGCPAAFLNSSLNTDEYHKTINEIEHNKIKLLYIAPERLEKSEITTLATAGNIPLVVVDEAHCISQWGHDFRTSYLNIAKFISRIKKRPVCAAFTATATLKVRNDIQKLLALQNPYLINTGFDRPNLCLELQKPNDKKSALLACLAGRKEQSGLVYCSTRKTVEEVCSLLCSHGFLASRYHAGLDDEDRKKNQDDFLYDRKTVMVATNAFGMGIDKSNVSFVIHYNMPKNIESYYQEAGRAGRDGEPADCILLYSGQDVQINKFLITHGGDDEQANPALVALNLELLKQMTFYATSRGCLRKQLLAYFGEQAPAYCGNCSNCLTGIEVSDLSLEGRKIVSCVYRLKQRNRSFGKTMIIDILRGGKNEKITNLGLDSLSTWGIMTDTSAHKIRAILDCMIDEGILKTEGIEYPVITIGNAGPLLREERRLLIKLPREQEKAKQSLYSQLSETKKASSLSGIDETLFEKLKKLRKELAAKEAMPAFIIFGDASLRDMCRKRPVSLDEFSAVSGVGAVKLEKYGKVFTELIRDYCNTEKSKKSISQSF